MRRPRMITRCRMYAAGLRLGLTIGTLLGMAAGALLFGLGLYIAMLIVR